MEKESCCSIMIRNLLNASISFFLVLSCLAQITPYAQGNELILCGWDEVFILRSNPSEGISTNKVWSWKASQSTDLPEHLRDKFRSTDECKPVDGGQKILVTSSGGGVALLERATGKALFYAFIGNAHSAEILPGSRVVVAGSRHEQGNCLAVFNLDEPEKVIYSEPLDSGHGVFWDEELQVLWALGFDELKALRLKDWETPEPGLELLHDYRLPSESGHDLVPVPNSDELLITTNKNVFLFDKERRTFRLHPELGDLPVVKGVSIHPLTGQTVYTQAKGENWWTDSIRTLHPEGELQLPGERLYKARWIGN